MCRISGLSDISRTRCVCGLHGICIPCGHDTGRGKRGTHSSLSTFLMKLKDGMNTTSATRTSEKTSPLIHRVARKWYSWAGLALTMTTSYLAFDGQLRFEGPDQLLAAPPPAAADVKWQTNLAA